MAKDLNHEHQEENYNDDKADALATVAIIGIVVATVAYWLSGMPV